MVLVRLIQRFSSPGGDVSRHLRVSHWKQNFMVSGRLERMMLLSINHNNIGASLEFDSLLSAMNRVEDPRCEGHSVLFLIRAAVLTDWKRVVIPVSSGSPRHVGKLSCTDIISRWFEMGLTWHKVWN
ncbi:19434_t:CDS:2 [Funneliformis geosporum]|nr:19434_t:CDS:2 [Funneliformis geosporum]